MSLPPDTPPEGAVMGACLDSIFADVQKHLPSIDFEISDVSSDEEVSIFQRANQPKLNQLDDDEVEDESVVDSAAWEAMFQGDSLLSGNTTRPSYKKVPLSQVHKEIAERERQGLLHSPTFSDEPDDDILYAPVPQRPNVNSSVNRGVDANLEGNTAPSLELASGLMNSEAGRTASPISISNCTLELIEKELNRSSQNDSDQLLEQVMGFSKNLDVQPPQNLDNRDSVNRNENQGIVLQNNWVNGAPCNISMDSTDDEVSQLNTSQRIEDAKNKNANLKNQCSNLTKYSEDVIGQYFSQSGPTLGFHELDFVDLDTVLQDSSVASPFIPISPPQSTRTPGQPISNESPEDSMSLIERLAQLSVNQSGTNLKDIDPQTGAVLKKQDSQKQEKTQQNLKKAQNQTAAAAGTSANIIKEKKLEITRKLTSGPETVFIDLRNFDAENQKQVESVAAVRRVLKLDQESDSSDSDDSDVGNISLWHTQRRQIKDALRKGQKPGVAVISRQTQPQPPSEPVGQTHMKAQRLARPKTATVSASTSNVDQSEDRKPPTPADLKEKERQKELEAARKLREQKEQERQSRVRLGHRLEALRPSHSTKGKQPSADATPTLFDVESSYEPAPQSLPTELPEDLELVLLTIRLSTVGEMVPHRGGTLRGGDTGGFSASYTAVLTWLLSLVPDSLSVLTSPCDNVAVPFYVLGLQQLFLEGQLMLYVTVCPVDRFTAKDMPNKRKMRMRECLKDGSPFQQVLAKYFLTHCLFDVSPWLEDLVSCPIKPRNQDSEGPEAFVYTPPLPHITTKPLSTFIHINPDLSAARKVFQLPIAFFWLTIETDESSLPIDLEEQPNKSDIQTTLSLIYKHVYRDPQAAMGILSRVLQEGLDLAGIRLLYPTADLIQGPGSTHKENTKLSQVGPVLALAVRGTFARSVWLDAVGPADPTLARRTDPMSLCALYGGNSREECLLFCPRNPSRINTELARWFGGRVPPSGVIDVGTGHQRPSSGNKKNRKSSGHDESSISSHMPPAALNAATHSDIFVVLSPLVPVAYLGFVLTLCERRGYELRGVRRMRLNQKRLSLLGIASPHAGLFTTEGECGLVNGDEGLRIQPCTVLLLNKENASHTAASLLESIVVQMAMRNWLGPIQACLKCPLTLDFLLHYAGYSDSLLHALGGDFSKVPETDFGSPPGHIAPKLYSNPESEEIMLVALRGREQLKQLGQCMNSLFSPSTGLNAGEGMELLGIKWLPNLRIQHARELTPYEVGDHEWRSSIQTLTSGPAVVLLVRRVDAFSRMEQYLGLTPRQGQITRRANLDKLMSYTPDMAYRLAKLIFHERELFPDPRSRSLLKYLPPVRSGRTIEIECKNSSPKGKVKVQNVPVVEESILQTMLSGPRPITTLLVVKPDAVQRHLSKLLRRVSQEGFKVVGLCLETLSPEQAELLMDEQVLQNAGLKQLHLDYLTRRPSLVLSLQRENAVRQLLDILGPSDPREARRQQPHFWHAVFGTDPVANGVYGSRNYQSSVLEQKAFFRDGLCCTLTEDLEVEEIPCPAEDSILDAGRDGHRQVVMETASHHPMDTDTSHTGGTGTSTSFNLPVTSLTQTNVVVLPPSLTHISGGRARKYPPYIQIVDHLLHQGFEVVAARLVWFTESHAEHLLQLLDMGNFKMVRELTCGPSLILAVQRDNAIMTFDTLLGSSFDKESVYSKYNTSILRARDHSQANGLLGYLFDKLTTGAQAKIIGDEIVSSS